MMKRWIDKFSGQFSRKRSRSLIGLDLGTTVLKAVEVTLDEDDFPVVTGVARRELKPGEELTEALAAMLEEADFSTKEVATAVSGKSVVVRHLSTSNMTDDELSLAMRFEADKFLPFDSEEVLMDCQRLERQPQLGGEDDDGQTDTIGVALAACRNTAVEEQYRTVVGAGLVSVAVDAEVFSLVNAFGFCSGEFADTRRDDEEEEEGVDTEEEEVALVDDFTASKARTAEAYGADDSYEDDEDEYDPYTGDGAVEFSSPPPLSGCAIAIADVGATRTQISVVIGGETCFSRDIGVGGADMTQAIARRLSVETDEAEEIKRMPGDHAVEVDEALDSVIDDLVAELTMSLDFVENHEGLNVGKVLITGGGAATPGLLEAVLTGTAREAVIWDLFENIKINEERVDKEELEKHGASFAVAIGLASRVVAA